MSEISDRILILINKNGYSYAELSALTGIPKSALQRYATGQTTKIPLDRIASLARVLGVSSEHILGWESPNRPETNPGLSLSSQERTLILSYRKADAGTRAAVEKLLDLPSPVSRSREA